jgi:AmiR/NasT family two-component response regulator
MAAVQTMDSTGPMSSSGVDPGRSADSPAERIGKLEDQVFNLRRAIDTQRLIGTLIGILATRWSVSTDDAWAALLQVSHRTNIKVREIARVCVADLNGQLRPEDAVLLEQLTPELTAAAPSRPASD